MSVQRFGNDVDANPPDRARVAEPMGITPGQPLRAQDAQRFKAMVQARSALPDESPDAPPKTRLSDAEESVAAADERPEHDPRWRWPADEPLESEGVPNAVAPPLPDWLLTGQPVPGQHAPPPVGGQPAQKLTATQEAMRAQRRSTQGVSAVGAAGRASRSLSALQAALASAPPGPGKSSRFVVDSGEWGRIGFLVRRDSAQTQVVLELDRHVVEHAATLRQSVQGWLEARGHAGVRVAIALRAAAKGAGAAGAVSSQQDAHDGTHDA